MFSNDCSIESVLKEQYQLSKECNIPPSESDNLPDFERAVYLNYVLQDKKKEYDSKKS